MAAPKKLQVFHEPTACVGRPSSRLDDELASSGLHGVDHDSRTVGYHAYGRCFCKGRYVPPVLSFSSFLLPAFSTTNRASNGFLLAGWWPSVHG
jgi:hypothetical protein